MCCLIALLLGASHVVLRGSGRAADRGCRHHGAAIALLRPPMAIVAGLILGGVAAVALIPIAPASALQDWHGPICRALLPALSAAN
ncbi:hypothetical protein [Rhodopseudomonas sp. B29]|uniref:hypothetical protein n=1 Tax=Rhodopseudomonas sp. B29 TaxID=95607 RepID=UPI0003465F81|nr:hypothetical protein [Rhodopseudomonas sp. B29]